MEIRFWQISYRLQCKRCQCLFSSALANPKLCQPLSNPHGTATDAGREETRQILLWGEPGTSLLNLPAFHLQLLGGRKMITVRMIEDIASNFASLTHLHNLLSLLWKIEPSSSEPTVAGVSRKLWECWQTSHFIPANTPILNSSWIELTER